MTTRATLILLCGLSFSGKSTLAGQLGPELKATVLSLDSINEERGLYGGQGIPVEEWVETNRLAEERCNAHLQTGRNVIIDDTGSPRFIRDQWREIAARTHAAFALVWIQIDPELQRERLLANRLAGIRHDVTDEVLLDHVTHFESPTDEGAITINARDVSDPQQVEIVVGAIRALVVKRRRPRSTATRPATS
jgi:predicted kinase